MSSNIHFPCSSSKAAKAFENVIVKDNPNRVFWRELTDKLHMRRESVERLVRLGLIPLPHSGPHYLFSWDRAQLAQILPTCFEVF